MCLVFLTRPPPLGKEGNELGGQCLVGAKISTIQHPPLVFVTI